MTLRIAVLHWHTSSVGGIGTTLSAYKKVAEAKGDVFHVLASDNQKTKRPGLFAEPRYTRGGDSFIWIDGTAPHHENNYGETAAFLRANYDVVMTSFICPHPTKAYGPDPVFMNLIESIVGLLPLVGYIHDAYWDTYSDWAKLILPYCDKTLVAQKAYGDPLVKLGFRVQPVYLPFIPRTALAPRKIVRDMTRVLWTPQLKNIKGVYRFLSGAPALLRNGHDVHIYNNGIEYYKFRLTPEYKKIVGTDLFAPEFGGRKVGNKATFHGCVPLEEIETALQGAGFMIDFQGYKAKYVAYTQGSYNHTVLEALYFGAVPVVHVNMTRTMPEELVLAVSDLGSYPEAIRNYREPRDRRARAREYVLDNYSAEKLYDKIFKAYRRGRTTR